MKRVFIIHGWDGNPKESWFPWLKKELETKGYKVQVPSMPNAGTPIIEEWLEKISKIVGAPDKDTFFVGHSIGCQAILRYLETIITSISGAVFVAGWFDLENMESPEEEEIGDPWINTPIEDEKIKRVLPKSSLIISDNDPYGAFELNKKRFSELGSKIIVLHDAGHINQEDGYTELPEVLKEIESF